MLNLCEWQRKPEKTKGIICACDREQEWLLPWWWKRYHAENDFPVTFVDFGMTQKAQKWCLKRGEVVHLNIDASFVRSKEQVARDAAQEWERFYGHTLWKARYSWFKKPFALLHSSYQISLWIDLDCEILAPLDDVFNLCTSDVPLALVSESFYDSLDSHIRYNGGVIGFVHGTQIIQKWAEGAIARNGSFWSDDALLSALIRENQTAVVELPEIYNWRMAKGVNLNAIIHHWVGSAGKAYIKNYGGIKTQLLDFHKNKLFRS